MARKVTARRVWVSTAAAWLFGFLIFLPILWMFLTSFKTELEAFAMPPVFLFFHWTTENYATVQGRSDYLHHALNSILIAGGSTLIAMLIAVPAAWSMAFAPTKRTKDVLLWMLSTKMMPPVGVLVPIYLIYRDFGMLDTRAGLVMILCLGNLPIVIWMLFTYFKEIPKDILEAARMDGATIGRELVYVLAPMAIPGLASTLLLNFILAWNEAFWTLNLSTLDAAPLTVFIASYSSPEGLFWAKLSAASGRSPIRAAAANFAWGRKVAGLPRPGIDRKVEAAAATLNLPPYLERKPRDPSGGQRQRAASGRAIVREPKAFLFDEPLSNLDAQLRVQMRAEIARLHQRLKATVVYVTHDQVEAMTLGQRIVLMDKGVVQQADT